MKHVILGKRSPNPPEPIKKKLVSVEIGLDSNQSTITHLLKEKSWLSWLLILSIIHNNNDQIQSILFCWDLKH